MPVEGRSDARRVRTAKGTLDGVLTIHSDARRA